MIEPEFVSHVGAECVGFGELNRNLARQRSVQTPVFVNLGQLFQLDVRELLELDGLAGNVGELGVALRGHGCVLTGGH